MGNGGGGYKPVRVVQFLLLAFEYNNLFPKPIDSWPMGTVSLPKYKSVISRVGILGSTRLRDGQLTHPTQKPGLRDSGTGLQNVQAGRTSDHGRFGVRTDKFYQDLLDMQVWPNILLSKISCCSCLLYFSFFYKTKK